MNEKLTRLLFWPLSDTVIEKIVRKGNLVAQNNQSVKMEKPMLLKKMSGEFNYPDSEKISPVRLSILGDENTGGMD